MIYFLLPGIHSDIYCNITCELNSEQNNSVISQSLSHYLIDIKQKINKYKKEWDIFKKYTNPYEYINTIIPFKSKCIAKYKPLSRSYYKMIEILNTFQLHNIPNNITTFHLAEGPGGFIEALVNIRSNKDDIYYGMTILEYSSDDNIPAWKKSEHFLNNNPNVIIENGQDGTGNILSISNFIHCNNKYASSMDIITADGGFDFSLDFNNQENNISRLLFGQVCYALIMQKHGGSFILKVFDCFSQHTIDILYILSAFYEKVYITKPQTSRYANSEKYIVCKNFKYYSNSTFYSFLYVAFSNMLSSTLNISRFINIKIPCLFITKIEEYNAIFGQQQIENIYHTLLLIENKNKNEKIDMLIKSNIQKCIHWCIKYNVSYNMFSHSTNLFLQN